MELYLIRHAQSANNAQPESSRVPDPPLTELGREQASLLASFISCHGLTRLITSPFLRTLETAEILYAELGLVPEVRIQLHEQGGCYSGYLPMPRIGQPGMTRAEIEQRFPDFLVEDGLDGEGWWREQPYETWEEARVRAAALLKSTRDEFAESEERVGFVMHADIKGLLLEHVHDDPLEIAFNASFSKLLVTSDRQQLVQHNCIEHLPPRLITS